ncbi:MAG: helix-turn-helix domain-containing protein [Wolinella sp.]
MKEFFSDSRLSDGAKVLYLFLLQYPQNFNNRELCEGINCGERSIVRYLGELESAQYVAISYKSRENRSGRVITLSVCQKEYTECQKMHTDTQKRETNSSDKNGTPININELELDSNIESSLSSFKDSTYKIDSNYHTESLEKENKREKIKKEKNKEKSPLETLALPKSLNHELWRDFITYRAEIKKPLKSVGKSRMIHRLLALEAKGININEALEATIRSGWQDVYEPKNRGIPDEFASLKEHEIHEKIKEEVKKNYGLAGLAELLAVDCKTEFYAFGRRVERIPYLDFGRLRFARV